MERVLRSVGRGCAWLKDMGCEKDGEVGEIKEAYLSLHVSYTQGWKRMMMMITKVTAHVYSVKHPDTVRSM